MQKIERPMSGGEALMGKLRSWIKYDILIQKEWKGCVENARALYIEVV